MKLTKNLINYNQIDEEIKGKFEESTIIEKPENNTNENNTNVKVWADGKATRDFIHAHDVAVGILDALNLFLIMLIIAQTMTGIQI